MSKTEELVKAIGVDIVQLTSYRSQASELVQFLTHSPCKTAEQEAYFSARLSDVRALIKNLDAERTKLTKPLLAAKKAVDELFSPAIKPLQEAESVIRGKLAGAAMGRLERERAAMQLAAEAATAGDSDAVMSALAAIPQVAQTTGSSVKYVWVPDKVDVEVLPKSYMVVDTAKLEGVGRAAGDSEPKIVGVTWRQEARVRAK